MKQRSGKFRLSKNTVFTLVLALVALVLLGVFAWSQSRPSRTTTVTPQPSATVPMGGHGPNTTVAAGPSHDTTPSATPSTISNPSHPVSGTMAVPTGPLLNVHKFSMSDCKNDPGVCSEDSQCNSVAGASCVIQATLKGSDKAIVVAGPKTVPSDTTGADLPWNPGDKLSVGTWSVVAVATLNDKQGTSASESLEIDQ